MTLELSTLTGFRSSQLRQVQAVGSRPDRLPRASRRVSVTDRFGAHATAALVVSRPLPTGPESVSRVSRSSTPRCI